MEQIIRMCWFLNRTRYAHFIRKLSVSLYSGWSDTNSDIRSCCAPVVYWIWWKRLLHSIANCSTIWMCTPSHNIRCACASFAIQRTSEQHAIAWLYPSMLSMNGHALIAGIGDPWTCGNRGVRDDSVSIYYGKCRTKLTPILAFLLERSY